ncbi:carbohydrate diacid regulon transcriptional regulator CdaR, partial [Klebsiella pneumoniae]
MQRDDDSFMLVPSKGEDYMAGWHLDTKMAQDIVARTMRIIDTNINV